MVNNSPTPVSYGPTSSGWGGGSGGVPSASCTGTVIATFTWQAANANDLPPAQVVVAETCTASTSVAIPYQTGAYDTGLGGSGSTGSVTCTPGGSHNSISGTSVRYTVQKGGQTLTLPTVSPSATGGGEGSSCTVAYTASIVNGNWVGPYYFHYGIYNGDGDANGPVLSNWADNTAGSTPTIQDIPDGNHKFTLTATKQGTCQVKGTITPVWYWVGPDLGVAPPAFRISDTCSALAVDYYQNDRGITVLADDGLGNGSQQSSNSAGSTGSQLDLVTVQSDEYAPGQGNSYWAIGSPFTLNAKVTSEEPGGSLNLYTTVELDASVVGQ